MALQEPYSISSYTQESPTSSRVACSGYRVICTSLQNLPDNSQEGYTRPDRHDATFIQLCQS